MIENQKTISDWQLATFGIPSSCAAIAARANVEMSELLLKLAADDMHPGALKEIADVVIVLMGLADDLNGDLLAEVDRKMAINRARKWKMNGDGMGQHIDDDSQRRLAELEG